MTAGGRDGTGAKYSERVGAAGATNRRPFAWAAGCLPGARLARCDAGPSEVPLSFPSTFVGGSRYRWPMQDRFGPAIAANRFGLGARPGELVSIGRDPRGWLTAQLKGGAPQMADTGLRSSQSILAETIEWRRENREMRKANGGEKPKRNPEDKNAAVQQLLKLPQIYRPLYISEVTARLATSSPTRPSIAFWRRT